MARTIGTLENLDRHSQEILELAAVMHDIACPLCREKYRSTDGKNQEQESPPLVATFFADFPLAAADTARISWLVAHHHTYSPVDGLTHQILLEADYLVNAGESGYPQTAILEARNKIFHTSAGIRLLDSIYR